MLLKYSSVESTKYYSIYYICAVDPTASNDLNFLIKTICNFCFKFWIAILTYFKSSFFPLSLCENIRWKVALLYYTSPRDISSEFFWNSSRGRPRGAYIFLCVYYYYYYTTVLIHTMRAEKESHSSPTLLRIYASARGPPCFATGASSHRARATTMHRPGGATRRIICARAFILFICVFAEKNYSKVPIARAISHLYYFRPWLFFYKYMNFFVLFF